MALARRPAAGTMAIAAQHHHLRSHLATAATALILALISTIEPLAVGDPLAVEPLDARDSRGQLCGTSGNYTRNDTYQGNIGRLAATLPANTSASPTLFATGTVGSVPDVVHALALCRGDANASACGDCVATAFQDAQQLCAYNKDATVFYDICLLRYSNQNYLASTGSEFIILTDSNSRNASTSIKNYTAIVVSPSGSHGSDASAFILVSTQNVTAPFGVFDAAVAALLNATAAYAAANSSRRFGTGVQAFQKFDGEIPRIYGLAQCTPDMAPADCRSCLSGIIQLAPKYFSGKQGGRILRLRCNYRYELYRFFASTPLLQLPAPAMVNGRTTGRGNRTGRVLAIILPIVVFVPATVIVCYCRWGRKRKLAGTLLLHDSTNPEDIRSIDSLMIDLATLRATTGNFNEGKKLGEGGFGAVYKGTLPTGREIAVKRLSQSSRQGIKELEAELVLVAKLQHKNLVRLVGVCLEKQEKLLVYEYMPNNSLETFIFDPNKSSELDWQKRFMIINGIAQGLQYLHEESQLKIVHRDLKASNVLLDSDFSPKISDFGLARLFGSDQSQYVTNRVVGTYGYMAPEYAMRGHYSTKSDVFSFGILVLEIVTGRRNNGGSYDSELCDHLLSRVWEQWTMGTVMDIMDPSLSSHPNVNQTLKCIHIGLLCVQHNPADRPLMSTVSVMLSRSTMPSQAPSRPAFCFLRSGVNSEMYRGQGSSQLTSRSAVSENEITVTELEAR